MSHPPLLHFRPPLPTAALQHTAHTYNSMTGTLISLQSKTDDALATHSVSKNSPLHITLSSVMYHLVQAGKDLAETDKHLEGIGSHPPLKNILTEKEREIRKLLVSACKHLTLFKITMHPHGF